MTPCTYFIAMILHSSIVRMVSRIVVGVAVVSIAKSHVHISGMTINWGFIPAISACTIGPILGWVIMLVAWFVVSGPGINLIILISDPASRGAAGSIYDLRQITGQRQPSHFTLNFINRFTLV